MEKKKYNWWADPANKETVDKMSWWEHPENKTTIPFPVSIVEDDGYWVIGCNSDTENLVGERLASITCQGGSKEEVVRRFFLMLRLAHEYEDNCRRKYQVWVPFRKGPWKSIGGNWFTVFGINFNFRYGKSMKGGWYIPFTKLNISIHNEWKYINQQIK